MASIRDLSIPHDVLSLIEVGDAKTPSSVNDPLTEILANLVHLRTGQLLVVEQASDLSAYPGVALNAEGGIPLAFSANDRTLWVYDPRDGQTRDELIESALGDVTRPSSHDGVWVRLTVPLTRSLYFDDVVGTAVNTEDTSLGLSTTVPCDGVTPVEAALTVEVTGSGARVEILMDGVVIATAFAGSSAKETITARRVLTPTQGGRVFTARFGGTTSGTATERRTLSVRIG